MLQQKQKEYNWYYTQIFADNVNERLHVPKFVTFANTPAEAKELATAKTLELYPKATNLDINLYQKNYIRESRELVEEGRYAGVKPASV